MADGTLDQRRLLPREADPLTEGSGDLGSDYGMVTSSALADIVEKCRKGEGLGGVDLGGYGQKVAIVAVDEALHLCDGAPEMGLHRVLVEWSKLRDGSDRAPLGQDGVQMTRLPETLCMEPALLSGAEKGCVLAGLLFATRAAFTACEPTPHLPAERIGRVGELWPSLRGEAIDRLQGVDQRRRDVELVGAEPAGSRLAKIVGEGVIGAAG
ncbi:hypothetical protein BH23ACT5_BH23ACT5_06320 [soil metagenome]